MTSDPQRRENRTGKQKPFPWRCLECGQTDVVPKTSPYAGEVKHDGRLHTIEIPQLEIPTCGSCGAQVFSNHVDAQISKALRAHLRLLTPEQILAAIKQLGMSQKGVAQRLGIAEATMSRWVNGLLIQSRAMDNLLRVYFASSDVRGMLLGAKQDPELGTTLTSRFNSVETPA